jgi:hypothetical protein
LLEHRPANSENSRSHTAASARPTSGRVVHDPRGNAVWDWAIETGVLAKATTAELLKKLADPAPFVLELETCVSGRGWGGDPYNRSKG